MSSTFPQQFWRALRSWWCEQAREKGAASAASLLIRNLWAFVRESTPERRRQRYGDMEYDWEHRVNTTSGTVSRRARLLGLFHSPYQPTEPALFQEMMASLPIEFDQFTFVDLGSGKGRPLLMASEYPFMKIVGVELIEELHVQIEALHADASEFVFPDTPLVLYLFNPLPQAGLRRVLASLDRSLSAHPRAAYVLYHNPLLECALSGSARLTKMGGTQQYSIYAFRGKSG